jgi:diguanylate cyclase (GGDEF)-like protein/putative nucleotidyltransferase with HDIG domain
VDIVDSANAGEYLLRRVCQRERLQRMLREQSARSTASLVIATLDGHTLLSANVAPDRGVMPQHHHATRIWHGDQPVGIVAAGSDNMLADVIAPVIALWIEDMLTLEAELASLTHEVVHAYEELHVLYELGAALSGVLAVEAVCETVVRTILRPLDAACARLVLTTPEGERIVAELRTPDSNRTNNGPTASALLRVNAEAIGTLIVEGKQPNREFSSNALKLLDGIAAVAAPAVRAAQLYEIARQQADTDGLTGVFNHRWLQERIDEEMERARRHAHPLTIMLADLDNFKLFNDVYGHPIGDRVLQTVIESLRASTRSYDIIGRYGGDEFMIILPETAAADAAEVASRILSDIAQREIIIDGERLPIGLSLGLAAYPHDAITKHELIAHADSTLYESKRSGGGTIRGAGRPRSDWLALQSSSFGVLEGLVQSVDAKDHYTREHSEVVTEMALMLAQRLNLSEETRRALRIAGLLHDVGKIGIPDSVLKKPGRLNNEEYEIMKQHVSLSEMMIKNVPYLNDVLDAVAHHHERYDGGGYPHGRAGEEIPLLGRIMAIADAYSAMRLDRPYRKGLSWFEARQELAGNAGSQFDPELVTIFIDALDELHGLAAQPSRAEAA